MCDIDLCWILSQNVTQLLSQCLFHVKTALFRISEFVHALEAILRNLPLSEKKMTRASSTSQMAHFIRVRCHLGTLHVVFTLPGLLKHLTRHSRNRKCTNARMRPRPFLLHHRTQRALKVGTWESLKKFKSELQITDQKPVLFERSEITMIHYKKVVFSHELII